MIAIYIRPPAYAANVGDRFVVEHPDIAGVWLVARVPPPQLPTLHGVLFWGHDGWIDDYATAKQFATFELACAFKRLMNS